ncbi:MAG TPA: D-alanyl-D-alanine carboxypeptidase/D-alanyl-D-alanine-endopeptidase [Acidobacteriaceae bacterium]|jgi:D-alanyl-D-alanine carboxypeptidase/D-alanyl-D-alanine-endopeptidase (penicillin-binding protein 4)|nr:D-alanyl-D-alanine carboxypeptidase/D-alanyl-D-alanine-endopeptidase [Acidobacteriaceae bacterium]
MNNLVGMTCAFLFAFTSATAQPQQAAATTGTFTQAVRTIMDRSEFKHVSFGLEIYSLDQKKVLFALNGNKYFTPGSTTKLLTIGTALHYLGPDFRFHTAVYRTGPVKHGVLYGNLVLVASGDPNLSDRLQSDGSLAFANEDHSYGGHDSRLIPGNAAIVLQEFADQIRKAGVREVQGHVVIDVSLFPEGTRELGTGMVISPICVNDNAVDVMVTAGSAAGSSATLAYSLQVPYLHFVNNIKTGAPGSQAVPVDSDTATNPDGTETVTLTGSIPPDQSPYIYGYPVSSPSRFAQALFTEALTGDGIRIRNKNVSTGDQKNAYTPDNRVAEHISAPYAEEAKVTLKVSQNLHASMTPYILGALVGKATKDIATKGFSLEHDFFTKGNLSTIGASQGDGAGGALSAYFTPDFMVHYLAFMSQQPDFSFFRRGLPILGRDGTLFNVETNSPAAGKVFAKTGTFGAWDELNRRVIISGKGLAGYTTTASGEPVAFAFYMNHLELQDEKADPAVVAGAALGAIASAMHDLPIDRTSFNQP